MNVSKQDAEAYCRILTLLGMEEEGDPIVEIQRLVSQEAQVGKDAERYRHLRDRESSLEVRQYDKGIINGPSCYRVVGGVRELKWGDELDTAIDVAIAAAKGQA